MIFWTFNAHTTETALMCNSTHCNFLSELTSIETKFFWWSQITSQMDAVTSHPPFANLTVAWSCVRSDSHSPPPSPHLPVLLTPCPSSIPHFMRSTSWSTWTWEKSTSHCHCHCNLCGQQHTAKNDLCVTLHYFTLTCDGLWSCIASYQCVMICGFAH